MHLRDAPVDDIRLHLIGRHRAQFHVLTGGQQPLEQRDHQPRLAGSTRHRPQRVTRSRSAVIRAPARQQHRTHVHLPGEKLHPHDLSAGHEGVQLRSVPGDAVFTW